MSGEWLRFVGPESALEVFDVRLVGFNAENAKKLLFTLILIVFLVLVRAALHAAAHAIVRGRTGPAVEFWARQGVNLAIALLLILGIASIWFDDPARLATAFGLVTAGLAFALQKVITAVAGYFVILRGKTFNVGDRIVMGGVRGDVIALDFTQTTIMEMGQPPAVQAADPAMWVRSRQYTGRIVTVSNSKIFDDPVYNYTREFPYLWEELVLPISYDADAERVEQILLAAARDHSVRLEELGEETLQELQRRYAVRPAELEPAVYQRLTDNWLELTVRFIAHDHGVRTMKDKMSRQILQGLKAAGTGVASATFEIVGLPPLRIDPASARRIQRQGDAAAPDAA